MQITELLHRVHTGDQQALHEVIPLVYGELKKLAAGCLRREGKARPLDTTALVHEAFLRLAHGKHPSYENRSHFYGIASRLMRQVLVDLARARSREKRRSAREVSLAEIADLGRQPVRPDGHELIGILMDIFTSSIRLSGQAKELIICD